MILFEKEKFATFGIICLKYSNNTEIIFRQTVLPLLRRISPWTRTNEACESWMMTMLSFHIALISTHCARHLNRDECNEKRYWYDANQDRKPTNIQFRQTKLIMSLNNSFIHNQYVPNYIDRGFRFMLSWYLSSDYENRSNFNTISPHVSWSRTIVQWNMYIDANEILHQFWRYKMG